MAYRPKDFNERILHRLKIARGQLDKVMRMVEADEYCIDVLHQSQAVQKALKETDNIMLENHLRTHAVEAFSKGRQEEAVDEIITVFRKSQ